MPTRNRQSFDFFWKTQYCINPFKLKVTFLYPLKIFGFLMFSGGIAIEHWAKMDYYQFSSISPNIDSISKGCY